MKILIVDDDREIKEMLALMLKKNGYEILEAENGVSAIASLRENSDVDLCIMDIMMPEMDGVKATEIVRTFSSVPVLFLTARSLEKDKEAAYSSGGDDYLVKPFSQKELLMKVEALTRRYNFYRDKESEASNTVRLSSGVVINADRREVLKNGEPILMRDKELECLFYLAKNRGRCVSVAELYEAVWEEKLLPSSSNNVTVHILNLRRKLEDNSLSPKLIRTVWGRGYQID